MPVADPAAAPVKLEWQIATVVAVKVETPRVKTFTLALPAWTPHKAGQHYDIRLSAPDGYQAERSYSVASEPERTGVIDLTVQLIDDGEVSPYLHEVVVPGDRIELRGPIGDYFVWDVALGGPVLLVAGGSGIVPLMAMIRHRAAESSDVPMHLLYSSRTLGDVIYRDELELSVSDGFGASFALTREMPPGWGGYTRRIDADMLREVAAPLGDSPQCFVCGPTVLVEAVADEMVRIGVSPERVKTERFGPTGS